MKSKTVGYIAKVCIRVAHPDEVPYDEFAGKERAAWILSKYLDSDITDYGTMFSDVYPYQIYAIDLEEDPEAPRGFSWEDDLEEEE